MHPSGPSLGILITKSLIARGLKAMAALMLQPLLLWMACRVQRWRYVLGLCSP